MCAVLSPAVKLLPSWTMKTICPLSPTRHHESLWLCANSIFNSLSRLSFHLLLTVMKGMQDVSFTNVFPQETLEHVRVSRNLNKTIHSWRTKALRTITACLLNLVFHVQWDVTNKVASSCVVSVQHSVQDQTVQCYGQRHLTSRHAIIFRPSLLAWYFLLPNVPVLSSSPPTHHSLPQSCFIFERSRVQTADSRLIDRTVFPGICRESAWFWPRLFYTTT